MPRTRIGLCFLPFLLFACSIHMNNGVQGDGEVREVQREVRDFDQLENPSIIDVNLVDGDGPLTLRADSNLIPLVQIQVEQGTLTLDLEESIRDFEALEVKIPVGERELDRIEFDGTGDLRCNTTLQEDELKVENDGTSDMELNVELDRFEYLSDGTGDATLRGSTEKFRVASTGTGDVSAFELKAGVVQCKSSGTGDIEIHATDELYISLTGTGDIIYDGDPELKDVNVDGTGDLEGR